MVDGGGGCKASRGFVQGCQGSFYNLLWGMDREEACVVKYLKEGEYHAWAVVVG